MGADPADPPGRRHRRRTQTATPFEVRHRRWAQDPGVDYDKAEADRFYFGLKGYVTSASQQLLTGAEVINAYHSLFEVEASFRMAKSDLRARPIFHHTRDSIEAHLTMVFCALAVSRHMQQATGKSLKKILNTVGPLREAIVEVNGTRHTIPAAMSAEAQHIYAQLSLD